MACQYEQEYKQYISLIGTPDVSYFFLISQTFSK